MKEKCPSWPVCSKVCVKKCLAKEQEAKLLAKAFLARVVADHNVIRAAKRSWASVMLAASAVLENEFGVMLELLT